MTSPLDPALQQTVAPDETIDHGLGPSQAVVFRSGHADLGPIVDDAHSLRLMVRDDSGEAPIWRDGEDTLVTLGDSAQLQLPDDDTYDFVGAEPGDTVWVLPQTEADGVPWLGWNTQAPSVAALAERGVRFEFSDHRGPGELSLFIQNGGFQPPEVLWDGDTPSSIFVEPGVHTHANWVFTEPGAHAVTATVRMEGSGQSAQTELRFAVGIEPGAWTAPPPRPARTGDGASPLIIVLICVLVLVAAALSTGWVLKRRRAAGGAA